MPQLDARNLQHSHNSPDAFLRSHREPRIPIAKLVRDDNLGGITFGTGNPLVCAACGPKALAPAEGSVGYCVELDVQSVRIYPGTLSQLS